MIGRKTKRLQVFVADEVLKELQVTCNDRDKKMSELLREIINDAMRKQIQKKKDYYNSHTNFAG